MLRQHGPRSTVYCQSQCLSIYTVWPSVTTGRMTEGLLLKSSLPHLCLKRMICTKKSNCLQQDRSNEKGHNKRIIRKFNNMASIIIGTTFVCARQIKGERLQHWGDPAEEKRMSDKTPFTPILCDLTFKKSINQQIRPASMLWIYLSMSAKTWGWMQWNTNKQ